MACWFQSGLISHDIVFFSHNKLAPCRLISPETNQRTCCLFVCCLFLQFILCLLVSTYMASLWEKALHVQISLCIIVHQNGAHKRYQKNATEDRATPKIGDATRFIEPSAAVRSGLYQEKGHVQQRHRFIDATLSSPAGIARRPPRCYCLTLVGARKMLLRWLNYNVLIHIDCNIDLYANKSLLSYM